MQWQHLRRPCENGPVAGVKNRVSLCIVSENQREFVKSVARTRKGGGSGTFLVVVFSARHVISSNICLLPIECATLEYWWPLPRCQPYQGTSRKSLLCRKQFANKRDNDISLSWWFCQLASVLLIQFEIIWHSAAAATAAGAECEFSDILKYWSWLLQLNINKILVTSDFSLDNERPSD